jgi:murein L,D-transpeptidase YcbB/YkuD
MPRSFCVFSVVLALASFFSVSAVGSAAAETLSEFRLSVDSWVRSTGSGSSSVSALEPLASIPMTGKAIVVNLPAFEALLVEDDVIVARTPVIVGRPGSPTPTMSVLATAAVFDPSWNPPDGIRSVFASRLASGRGLGHVYDGLVAIDGNGVSKRIEDLGPADLASSSLRFHQPPGPDNALGRFKVELAGSPRSIKLHDTNERGLFSERYRALSSGCVRVRDWDVLAGWLTGTTREEAVSRTGTGRTRSMTLSRAVPVIVIYSLAWRDESGAMARLPDVYGRFGPRSGR